MALLENKENIIKNTTTEKNTKQNKFKINHQMNLVLAIPYRQVVSVVANRSSQSPFHCFRVLFPFLK